MTAVPPQSRIVASAILMASLAGCGLSLSIALLAVRLDAEGYSARAIGVNTAAGGVATLLGAPLVPWAARRIGVARLLMLTLAFGGLTMIAFTATSDYGGWLVLRFCIGLSVTVLFVLSEYWIGSAAGSGRRGFAIGLYAMSIGVGFAAGPMLLALVGTRGDLPFYLGAAFFLGAMVPLGVNMKAAPPIEEPSRKPFWRFLKESPLVTLAAWLHGSIEVACIGLLPVYALRAGASAAEGALFASLFVLGAGALQVPLGLLSDRVDRRLLLAGIASLGFAGALFLAAFGLTSVILFEIVLLAWGGIVGGLYPVGLAQLGARYRDADLAGANAAFVMTYSIGMLMGPPIIGNGLDLISPGGFFLAIAVLFGLYLVVAAGPFVRQRLRLAAAARSSS